MPVNLGPVFERINGEWIAPVHKTHNQVVEIVAIAMGRKSLRVRSRPAAHQPWVEINVELSDKEWSALGLNP